MAHCRSRPAGMFSASYKMKKAMVMFSDFGINSGLVACMHGVCAQVDPTLLVYDATHLLPAFDIKAASSCLQYTVPCWPAGTVFVSVVDPGVGTSRRACAALLRNGSYVITPDNGTLTLLDESIGIEAVRSIDETVNRYNSAEEVSVFHGRDLFAYCGARLAAGVISFNEVGPAYPVSGIVRYPVPKPVIRPGFACGRIESFDPFGTAETNFLNKAFKGAGFRTGTMVSISIRQLPADTSMTENRSSISGPQPGQNSAAAPAVFEDTVLYDKTFGCVPVGSPVLFPDLALYISIGINQGDFRKLHGMETGCSYEICITG